MQNTAKSDDTSSNDHNSADLRIKKDLKKHNWLLNKLKSRSVTSVSENCEKTSTAGTLKHTKSALKRAQSLPVSVSIERYHSVTSQRSEKKKVEPNANRSVQPVKINLCVNYKMNEKGNESMDKLTINTNNSTQTTPLKSPRMNSEVNPLDRKFTNDSEQLLQKSCAISQTSTNPEDLKTCTADRDTGKKFYESNKTSMKNVWNLSINKKRDVNSNFLSISQENDDANDSSTKLNISGTNLTNECFTSLPAKPIKGITQMRNYGYQVIAGHDSLAKTMSIKHNLPLSIAPVREKYRRIQTNETINQKLTDTVLPTTPPSKPSSTIAVQTEKIFAVSEEDYYFLKFVKSNKLTKEKLSELMENVNSKNMKNTNRNQSNEQLPKEVIEVDSDDDDCHLTIIDEGIMNRVLNQSQHNKEVIFKSYNNLIKAMCNKRNKDCDSINEVSTNLLNKKIGILTDTVTQMMEKFKEIEAAKENEAKLQTKEVKNIETQTASVQANVTENPRSIIVPVLNNQDSVENQGLEDVLDANIKIQQMQCQQMSLHQAELYKREAMRHRFNYQQRYYSQQDPRIVNMQTNKMNQDTRSYLAPYTSSSNPRMNLLYHVRQQAHPYNSYHRAQQYMDQWYQGQQQQVSKIRLKLQQPQHQQLSAEQMVIYQQQKLRQRVEAKNFDWNNQ